VNVTNLKVPSLVDDTPILNVGLHPIRLAFVDMLVPNMRFIDDTLFREHLAIKSLIVLVNDELWVSEVTL
jgi:hypothetical protein